MAPPCQVHVHVPVDSDSDIVVARQKGRGHDGLGDEMVSTIDRASVEWATANAVAPGHCDSGDECSGHDDGRVLARYRGARR